MKKIFRLSQLRKTIGFPKLGCELHKFGIPYVGAAGTVNFKMNDALLDYLLAAEERFSPQIHIVSFMDDGRVLNRFDKDASYCMLYPGNNDPDIEFSTDFCWDDIPEPKLCEFPAADDDAPELTSSQLHAINWSLKRFQGR
jgi:hypothetical protein